jgi:hypothetical protein
MFKENEFTGLQPNDEPVEEGVPDFVPLGVRVA